MKYLIIGAGGTGGILGAYMTKAGKNVTLIARNAHLAAMKEHGLTVRHLWDETVETIPVQAENMESYEKKIETAGEEEKPDVILVCVKGYSLDSTVPFIRKIAKKSTIVIPILNIYGTGSRLQEKLPGILVTDGCIYVSANIEGPGALVQHGKILRVVFGVKEKGKFREELKEIAKDFNDSGISGELSENIRRDAMEKFSYVSPIGAAGLYYHATAADFQREGEEREAFKAMIREIMVLAEAMGVPFERDYVKVNLEILSHLAPESTTSMQRDVMEGKQSEIDGLVYEVVRMGEKYHVPMPVYKKIADELKER